MTVDCQEGKGSKNSFIVVYTRALWKNYSFQKMGNEAGAHIAKIFFG